MVGLRTLCMPLVQYNNAMHGNTGDEGRRERKRGGVGSGGGGGGGKQE